MFQSHIVSEATMRNEDLIPSFADEILYILSNVPQSIDSIERGSELRTLALDALAMEYYNSEEAYVILDELFDALEELAPEGFYFGTLEGDGACYGFFQFEDAM